MSTISRHSTSLLSIVLILFMTLYGACDKPDSNVKLYANGVLWTGDAEKPYAEAMVVQGGRILAIGIEKDLRSAYSSAQRIDLEGRFITPGLIDNHTHFLSGGFQLASVNLRDADTPTEFSRRLKDFADSLPEGRWITGGDWDHELWGGELPDRNWIDSLTTKHPVFVTRLDGHMALVNSLALEMAGIGADSEDPPGGTIVRRIDGEPTGVLKDEAMNAVYAVRPDPTTEEEDEALLRAMNHAISLGITQVHDMAGDGWRSLETYRRALEKDELKIRIYSFVPISTWERMRDFVAENGTGDEWLQWGGLKGFVDGSLGSTTAWFHDPYEDEPGTVGLMVSDTTSLSRQIRDADAAGLHLAIHAIGDRANDWLLDVFEKAEDENEARDRRFRIEHAQHLTESSIERLAQMGVIPSMQPYHAADDGRWAEKRIGPERIRTTYAFRSLLDAGANLTFGSDWTVAPLDPRLGMHAAVTRQTIDGANPDGWVPEQKISAEEALRAYTTTNAYAGFQENRTGVLRAGALADFVIWSDNLLDVTPERLPFVKVLKTVVNGEEVFVGN